MKTIGIVGSRRRNSVADMKAVRRAFDEIREHGDRIVSGGCNMGADRFAENFARMEGMTITIHYADWSTGVTAGFVRNTLIASDADVLIAAPAPDRTGGTEDTIAKATKLGKKVILV